MPAPTYYNGLTCYVTVGGVTINCGEWSAERETKEMDTTTGYDAGDESCLPASRRVTGTFLGPVNGAPLLVINTLVALALFPVANYQAPITCTALLTRVGTRTQATDGWRFTINWRSSGPVTGI